VVQLWFWNGIGEGLVNINPVESDPDAEKESPLDQPAGEIPF
jgi:hypothetical protein